MPAPPESEENLEYLIPSHLKLNLTLRVTGKRSDGFHDIHSLFLLLPGAESLVIRTRSSTGKDLVRVYNYPVKGQNIVLKALCLLRNLGIDLDPLEVDILKAVPPGTGLGAGSGNAAAFIGWVRNSLGAEVPRSLEANVGSDVAFFCNGASMGVVTKAGEVVECLDGTLPLSRVVIVPRWRSDTATAYRLLDEDAGRITLSEKEAAAECLRIMASLASGKKAGLLPNDFIPALVKANKAYLEYFSRFEDSGALAWGISGSGSALFALYERSFSKGGIAVFFAGEPGIERILFWE